MKVTQKLLYLASAIALATGIARGQANTLSFEFIANSVGNFRQNPITVDFEGGRFGINVRDGNFVFDGCNDDQFYFPSMPCPLGATGFVSRGLENDPELSGRGPYFSITDIAPATFLRPFDPLSARLIAAPPSLLPRPLAGFEDRSLSVFFNLFSNFIRQFPITQYDLSRQYTAGERSRFDNEVVPGTYRYNFGSLANPAAPVVLEVNQFPMLDGFRKINNQKRGFRFTNLNYDEEGFALLDPFGLNDLTWEGNTINFISPALDIAYISIKPLADPTDPFSDVVLYDGLGPVIESPPGSFNFIPNPTLPLFPNFLGPTVTRVLLPSASNSNFILPPNFVQPGATGIIDLEFVVFRPTTNLIYESATRRFRLPVKVLDPFDGFILNALPPGTRAEMLAPDADFDGDGVSNFEEWVFKSDPAQSGSVPISPGVQMTANSSATAPPADGFSLQSTEDETGSEAVLEYKVAKLTNAVPALKYSIEHSTDMVNWTKIEANHPNWILKETLKEIKVTQSGDSPKTGGFFRTKVVTAN